MQHKEANLLEHSFYAELYRCYAPGLFAYVYRQTTSREDAEDIVLDVFLSVLQDQRFPTFDAQKQEAWLWAITRHKVVDYYRRSARRRHISVEWLSEPLCEDERQAPEQISLKREEYLWLSNTVRTLPELQQEVLRLRFGHGLKCEEIAPVVEKSTGAVRMILLRTLQRLRRLYQDREKGEKRWMIAREKEKGEGQAQTTVHIALRSSPSSFAAFSFRMRGRTSDLMSIVSKSAIQRSGVMNG